jgi:hypothetical protein
MKGNFKRYWAALIAGIAMLYVIVAPSSKEPIDSADGLYENPCCGSFTLRHGVLRAGRFEVPYVVEEGKKQPYIFPKNYIGVVGGRRIGIKPGQNNTMLVFDNAKLNPIVWLPGDDGYDYPFESQTSR